MAKQLYVNNLETTFLTAIKDTPVTGTPATELGYGILQVNTSTSAALATLTGGDYYVMTALKRSGSVESTIEVMRVTNVDTTTFPGECRLTVSRAQEGTTAKAYLTGDYFSLRLTKGALENLLQTGDKDLSGGIPGLTLFKINMRNVANTFTSWLTNTNTAARTYTFQDRDGTIADNTDLAAKQSTSGKDASGGYAGLTLFKLNLRNAANTITSWFTTAATVARTWTMPDKDGTVAMTSDITGTNSGTNTGDQTITLTSEATGTGTGSFAVTLSNAAVIGKVLTGYVSGSGTVAATDTIVQAVNKLNGNDALKQTLASKDATGGYAGLTLFKINFKNVANTFTSFFTNSNTAARTYTFQDRDGTIADNTNLAAKQATLVSGTNIKTVNGTSLLGSGNLVVSGLTVVPVSGTTQTAVAGNNYVLNNVAATAVTMPTTLVAGDPVTISPNNGLLTNTVDFGAKTVRFGANTMTGVVTLDLGAPMQLVAIDTTTWMWL